MKEGFSTDLRYIVERISKVDGLPDTEEFERSRACLAVGIEKVTARTRGKGSKETLVSFGYIAASICLWYLERWPPYSGTDYMSSFRVAR